MRTSLWGRRREDVENGLPDGWHARLWRRSPDSFFPPRGFEAAGLEEGVGDHRHPCVSMQTGPGSTFEVVEAEFLLERLMRLLTDPSGFDRGGELLQARIGWQVRHIVFLYFCSPVDRRSPTSQTSSPGMHCIRLSRMRCLWPSATRIGRAAKRHVSRPLVPRRQLTFCHFSPANAASAETGG